MFSDLLKDKVSSNLKVTDNYTLLCLVSYFLFYSFIVQSFSCNTAAFARRFTTSVKLVFFPDIFVETLSEIHVSTV